MREVKHTLFAGKALSLAEMFDFTVGATKIEGAVTFVAKMSVPEGESTAGGKLALQHLSLTPENGGPTVVVGQVNTVDQTAELRAYGHIATAYAARFKGELLPFGRGEYEAFVQRVRAFLSTRHYNIVVEPEPQGAIATSGKAAGGRKLALIVGAGLIVVGAAAAWLLRG